MVKKKEVMISFLLLLVLAVSLVSAFGVAVPYWGGNPLRVYPGETVTFQVNLQNTELSGDATVEATLSNDADGMASLANEENLYFIPEGTHETYLPIRVTVPSDANIGDTFRIILRLREVSEGDAGMITFGVASSTSIPVEITTMEESSNYNPTPVATTQTSTKEKSSNTLWYVLAALVIVVVYLYMRSKKGKK